MAPGAVTRALLARAGTTTTPSMWLATLPASPGAGNLELGTPGGGGHAGGRIGAPGAVPAALEGVAGSQRASRRDRRGRAWRGGGREPDGRRLPWLRRGARIRRSGVQQSSAAAA